MTDAQQNVIEQRSEVASLLIPLTTETLLLPNVTVAEVVPVGQVSSIEGAPNWLLGELQWRDISVPLISLELLNEQAPPKHSSRSRVAVLNTSGLSAEVSFIAILAQGLPRLARVTPDEITIRDGVEVGAFDELPVACAGEQAMLPNLLAIERKYLDYKNNN